MPTNKSYMYTHLIHSQVDASIGDNAQCIWQIAPVESPDSLCLQDLSGTIRHT